MVFNRGGRNLDAVPATIAALPQVAEKVTGRVPAFVDGGIRRGTDVLKGLALGANYRAEVYLRVGCGRRSGRRESRQHPAA